MSEGCRRSIQCIVPPYMVEFMARSADERLREWALVHLARAAAIRAVRSFAQQMPAMMVSASPTGKKNRLVYDARKKDVLPGKLVRSEGEGKSADVAVGHLRAVPEGVVHRLELPRAIRLSHMHAR